MRHGASKGTQDRSNHSSVNARQVNKDLKKRASESAVNLSELV